MAGLLTVNKKRSASFRFGSASLIEELSECERTNGLVELIVSAKLFLTPSSVIAVARCDNNVAVGCG